MPTKQDYINFFNSSIAQTGWDDDYPGLLKMVLGRGDFSGNLDVSQFIDDHKRDPKGAEKFAKYMMIDRPKGRYWFPRERQTKTDKQMKDIFEIGQKRKITEAVKGLNLKQPHSNLFIKGWGKDRNGNSVIIVGFPNDRGFAIQTNNEGLDETHYIIRRSHGELSTDELDSVGREITDYVQRYGSKDVKSRLKVYYNSKIKGDTMNRWGKNASMYEDFLFGDVVPLYKKRGTKILGTKFKIGDPVFIEDANSIGFIINGETDDESKWYGEVKTDTDGNQDVDSLQSLRKSHLSIPGVFNPYENESAVMEYFETLRENRIGSDKMKVIESIYRMVSKNKK